MFMGNTMKARFRMAFAVAILSTLAWTSAIEPQTATSDHEDVTFAVGSSATSEMLRGVEVLVAAGSELVPLGRTNVLGQLTIRKEELRLGGSSVVLFCREHFFCGALRLDEPDFFKFDRHLIHLAPFAVE
jgi:hypothetical protein